MKLIQKLKIWKELKRLEARVHQSPSPSAFVDLGQVYINLGMHERTLELADEGLALFPNSNELRKLRRFAKKNQLTGRVKDLKESLQKSAHPKIYRELAGLYLELGDFGAVRGTCEECIRRFPDDDGAHFVLGRSHLTGFYRDLTATEGLEAVRNLRRVIEIDPQNTRAHKLLADVFYRVGAVAAAREHLDQLKRLGYHDDDADAMRKKIDTRTGTDGGADIETMFHRVEANGSLTCAPLAARERRGPNESSPADPELGGVRETLSQIAMLDGVRKAAYIRGGRALVKGDIRDGKDAFLRVARVVVKAAQRSSRRMDIGSFSKGIVDCSAGQICLCSYGDVLAAVLCDEQTPADRVLDDLQELVANSLYNTTGPDR